MGKPDKKVIITCAVTGGIHTPTMSPHLPITPDQIARQSIEAAEAGASILHLHARDPDTGEPTSDPDVFALFLPRIKQSTNAVLNITTGGGANMTVEARLAAALRMSPEMCSLNMGTMNFGTFPLTSRYSNWRHDWEEKLLNSTRDYVFKNTFKDIEAILERVGKEHDVRFEFECYDVGHIQTLAYYLDKGLVRPPLFVQFVLGVLGGIDAHPEQLVHLKRTADRLLGDSYHFSVLGAGRHQMPLGTIGTIMGGNVRVGLEDSLTIRAGELATSNAEQVTKIRSIVEALGHEIASPDDVRSLLELKGGDRVGF